jgi:hypothetical protein
MIPQVGQVLWFGYTEDNRRGQGHTVRVVKIGRKWVTVVRPDSEHLPHCHFRFDLTDPRWFSEDQGYSAGRVWPNYDTWERERMRDRAMIAFRRSVEYVLLSPDVTAENVRDAARLLGLGGAFEAELEKVKP